MRVRLLNTSRNAAAATSPPLFFPPLFDTSTRDRRCLVHPSRLPRTRGLRVSTLRWIMRDASIGTARNTGRHDREVDHDIRSYVVQHRTGQRTCRLLMRAKILCCVRAGGSVVLTAVGLAAGPPALSTLSPEGCVAGKPSATPAGEACSLGPLPHAISGPPRKGPVVRANAFP